MIPPSQMSDAHLMNSYRMFRRRIAFRFEPVSDQEMLRLLRGRQRTAFRAIRKEAIRRGLTPAFSIV